MENAANQNLGMTILNAVEATQTLVGRNTNLGTILLLAPLASVPRPRNLREGIADVLAATNQQDTSQIYEAIRTAQPGGMGTVEKMDVQQNAPSSLALAMKEAADRDFIARQYAESFAPLFDIVTPNLKAAIEQGMALSAAIIHVHLQTLHTFPDSLIARKCGINVAEEASRRAGEVIAAGAPQTTAYQQALQSLDNYLRDPGHRRNPGTTADILAASLFILLRDGTITNAQEFSWFTQYANHLN
jgi:triphosphoribosyl-dephospho-CoA synthase